MPQCTSSGSSRGEAVTHELAEIAVAVDLLAIKIRSRSIEVGLSLEVAWAHFNGACQDLDTALAERFAEAERSGSVELAEIRRFFDLKAAA